MASLPPIFSPTNAMNGILHAQNPSLNTQSCIKGPFLVHHGCVRSTVIERRQHQLGRMADFQPPVTFLAFDLQNHEIPQIKSQTKRHPLMDLFNTTLPQKYGDP